MDLIFPTIKIHPKLKKGFVLMDQKGTVGEVPHHVHIETEANFLRPIPETLLPARMIELHKAF